MPDIWESPDGQPLKFQDGDYVRIESLHPETVHNLPFLSGYVRGYELFEVNGDISVGYALFRMGHNLLHGVKEESLVSAVEQLPHTCHGAICGLCGRE